MVQLTTGSYVVLGCSDWYNFMYLPKRIQRGDNGTGQLCFQLGQKLESPGVPYDQQLLAPYKCLCFPINTKHCGTADDFLDATAFQY